MKKAAWLVVLAIGVVLAAPAGAAPQDPQLERVPTQPAQALGITVGAALTNLVYFPVRLVVTTLTAELGGVTAWATGGDPESAHSVWNATEGQAFISPAILEGREQLRFGGVGSP